MGLLAPAALALGLLVAVPLILHLFQRHQGPRLVFPALRYLRRAEREHARRIKLRQLLLLALRALAVLLIAFLAARPFLRRAGAAHAPTAAVIVLDNSASSAAVAGELRMLDVLKERAIETLMRAGPDDRFWLLRAGSPADPALRGDAATIADRVRETEPVASAADLRAALERAASLVAAGADGRAMEIQLLSDLQASNWRGVLPARRGITVVAWTPAAEPIRNYGIAAVEVGGGLAPRAGERSTVAVAVNGASGADSARVRLSIGGRTAAAGIAPAGSTAVLPLPAQPEGFLSGWAEIDADALRLDDRRYFALNVTPPPRVSLGRAAPFLDEGLNVLADAGRVQRVSGGGDVIVAPAGTGLEQARMNTALIVLPPESPVELPAINQRLDAAGVNWRYGGGMASGEARFLVPAQTGDALMRQLATVQLRQTFTLQPPPGTLTDSVVLRLSDGSVWAVRGQRASGAPFVLLGSPLTPEATTIPTSAAMVPLLDRALGAWSARPGRYPDVQPAELVPLHASAVAVLAADGTRDSVRAGESYRASAQPGVYRAIDEAGVTVGAFVVNPPPAESDLSAISPRRLRTALNGWALRLADSRDDWLREIYQERLGRELWRPLVYALLLLLLLESALAAAGRARAASTPPQSPQTEPAVPV